MRQDHSSQLGKATLIVSFLALAMVVINAGFILNNRSLQEGLMEQQAVLSTKSNKISQNSTFANINQSLIQALTTAVIARKDEQIKALLIQNEVNLSGNGKDAPVK